MRTASDERTHAMTDDDTDPLDRVRRAKTRQQRGRWLDGGAVAAGALVAVVPQAGPALAFAVGVPESVVTAFAAATLLTVPLGAYVAGYLGGTGEGSGARHGLAAVAGGTLAAAFAGLLLAGEGVVAFGGVPASVALVAATALGSVVGALVGSVGGRRKRRDLRGGSPEREREPPRRERDA
ncbi:hypothetical protein M0R88_03695 [Halorussus gelatinilyticus]|uniref:Uncharacterized protein n=1 Tax=Halorussus gelatinilyticus TaxID=2937524 RepID=A0A8U0ILX4_9EURY|nr:hypothetical protein [Halorussus gelatinilyticus]UPW01214.1 hypothetical protein M0R88_03695 [Halorussus gelatinilyticus]